MHVHVAGPGRLCTLLLASLSGATIRTSKMLRINFKSVLLTLIWTFLCCAHIYMILLLKRVELTMHIKIALLDSIVSCMHYLCLSVCMSVFLYICLSVCLSACKLVCLHVCVCLSFDLSACLQACQHACVSIFLRACLSAWASRNLGLAPWGPSMLTSWS